MGGITHRVTSTYVATADFAVEMLSVALVGPIFSLCQLRKHYLSLCRDSICGTEGSLGSEPMFVI